MADHPAPRPAHLTKHIPLLRYPFRGLHFHLAQLDDGATNGTALWLGAQCLSLYLADVLKTKPYADGRRPRAVELGSGIGLSALALGSMGWDVLATDLPNVVSTVLSDNIVRNISQLPPTRGTIDVRILDWTVSPDEWVWTNGDLVASKHPSHQLVPSRVADTLQPPFDLIISSDTLYSLDIVQPLFRTIQALIVLSATTSPSRRPSMYLCLERRDPALIDQALSDAQSMWDLTVERVPQKKIARAMDRGGAKWNKEDWEGVEIWKLSPAHKA